MLKAWHGGIALVAAAAATVATTTTSSSSTFLTIFSSSSAYVVFFAPSYVHFPTDAPPMADGVRWGWLELVVSSLEQLPPSSHSSHHCRPPRQTLETEEIYLAIGSKIFFNIVLNTTLFKS